MVVVLFFFVFLNRYRYVKTERIDLQLNMIIV